MMGEIKICDHCHNRQDYSDECAVCKAMEDANYWQQLWKTSALQHEAEIAHLRESNTNTDDVSVQRRR